jgi:hypothetical protein
MKTKLIALVSVAFLVTSCDRINDHFGKKPKPKTEQVKKK